ncbi:hypothetical protein EKO04_005426 [Ascochyta lentis]|uniref:WSC domain-containing protein n=1 Tax=Ascochyta lentis TaxID=205686 RepID=A0A8H7MJA3_9PLEO|nr:hypothetical protein EKO04_005426 [Ascochyta lentis]
MYTPFSHLPVLGLTLLLTADVHGAAFNLPKRDLTVNIALPSQWSYSGCFTDNTNPRTLHAESYVDDSMTESSCIGFCNGKGYAYAGIEYGRECYCDNRILDTGVLKEDSECSFPCPGSSTEPCGAGNRMSIFTNGKGMSAGPVVNPGFDNWKSLGCYTDSIAERTLQYGVNVDGINTAGRCASACQQAGFTYAGMEYSAECYCGNSLRCPSAPTVASACNMACNGNATEFCGGPNAMNVYQLGNDPINACGVIPSSTSTSSAAAPTVTAGALCPGFNNTIYTDTTGQKYTTYCGFDYDGGYIKIGDLASYELCLQECDTLDACGAAVWTGGDGRGFCYMKEANRGLVPNANVMVAIRIPPVTSTSSSAVSSAIVSDSSSSISSSMVSSSSTLSVSSSSLSTITAPPSVITPSTTKGLGCPNPTPTAMVFGDNVYEYEWCCAKACALGDCVAFNYGDAQNCRTMNKVSTVTTSFYNWKAYSLVGVTPFTAYSFPPTTITPTPSSTKGLGCANPKPTAFTISSKIYNYEWCMAYMAPGSMNFSPGSFEGCAAACALGDCVAFNYADASNCRTMNRVASVTEPFYGWKAYSLVGVTPVSAASPTASAVSTLQTISVTIISTTVSTSSSTRISTTSSSSTTPSPSVTLGPYGTNACPNPTPVSFTISSKLYNYNFCMAYMAPGSVNFGPGSLEGCAKACADGNCLAFNYGYPDNCRTMGQVDAITAPYYGWWAYQFIGTAPLPTTTSTSTSTPSPSPTITANPYGANACPNPTPTSFTVSNTLYRYNFCMAYMAPGSVNFSPGSLEACAAACKGDFVAFNYGDPHNCRTMNRVDAITAPFYGWSAYQLIGATPLPTAV